MADSGSRNTRPFAPRRSAGVDRNGACQRSQQDQGAEPALLVDVRSPEPPTAASVATAAKVSVILIVAADGLSNRFQST